MLLFSSRDGWGGISWIKRISPSYQSLKASLGNNALSALETCCIIQDQIMNSPILHNSLFLSLSKWDILASVFQFVRNGALGCPEIKQRCLIWSYFFTRLCPFKNPFIFYLPIIHPPFPLLKTNFSFLLALGHKTHQPSFRPHPCSIHFNLLFKYFYSFSNNIFIFKSINYPDICVSMCWPFCEQLFVSDFSSFHIRELPLVRTPLNPISEVKPKHTLGFDESCSEKPWASKRSWSWENSLPFMAEMKKYSSEL